MVFNSIHFVVFFAVVYAVYRVLGRRGQNLWLLAASYYFYAAWDWRFTGLLAASTLVSWGAGLALGRVEVPEYHQVTYALGTPPLNTVSDRGVLGGEAKLGLDVLLNRRISVYLDGRFSYAHGNWAFTSSWGLGWGFGGPARD